MSTSVHYLNMSNILFSFKKEFKIIFDYLLLITAGYFFNLLIFSGQK